MKIKELFQKLIKEENSCISKQRRINSSSCLKIYYGMTSENLYRISFITTYSPDEFRSTKEIKVTQGMESENIYWTCFDLLNNEYLDVFFLFADSLIQSVEFCVNEKEALTLLKNRYDTWKYLFQSKKTMSLENYLGLFGELYFLDWYLINQIGVDKAVNAWVGSRGFSKDFSTEKTRYEVKTIGSNATTVKINSLAQLDSELKGHLVTIVVEKMSDEFCSEYCSVNYLCEKILKKIKLLSLKEEFISKILSYGYIIGEDKFIGSKYLVKQVNFYSVDERFPKLTRNEVPTKAINQVSYEILLSAIEDYMEVYK